MLCDLEGNTCFLHLGGGWNKFSEAGKGIVAVLLSTYTRRLNFENDEKLNFTNNRLPCQPHSWTWLFMVSLPCNVSWSWWYNPALGFCIPESVYLLRKRGRIPFCDRHETWNVFSPAVSHSLISFIPPTLTTVTVETPHMQALGMKSPPFTLTPFLLKEKIWSVTL